MSRAEQSRLKVRQSSFLEQWTAVCNLEGAKIYFKVKERSKTQITPLYLRSEQHPDPKMN